MEEQFTRRNENVWSSTGIAIWTIIRWIIRLNCISGFIVSIYFNSQNTMFAYNAVWVGIIYCFVFLIIGGIMDAFDKRKNIRYEGVLSHRKMEIIVHGSQDDSTFLPGKFDVYVNGNIIPMIITNTFWRRYIKQPTPINLTQYLNKNKCLIFPCNVGDHLLNIYIADRYSMVITLDNEIIMSNDRIHQNKLNEILG